MPKYTLPVGYTEAVEVEGEAIEVGRDPRRMTVEQLGAAGHHKRPLLAAIRANCLACCSDSPSEVRRCRMVQCDMWPYRMGSNPFVSRDYTDEQREAAAARLAAARARK
jgi:hypothetical protein